MALLAAALWLIRQYGIDAVRMLLLRELRAAVPGEITVDRIDVSFLPPAIHLEGLRVQAADGREVVAVAGLGIDLALWASLWEGAWIGDLSAESPKVLVRDQDPFWAFAAAPSASGGPAGAAEPAFLPRRLTIRSGAVEIVPSRIEGLRVEVSDILVDGELLGVLERHFSFGLSARGTATREGKALAIEALSVAGQVGRGSIEIRAAVLRSDAAQVQANARLTGRELSGQAQGDLVLDSLFALFPEAGIVTGRGAFTASWHGALERPIVEAEVEADSVRIDDVVFSGNGSLRSEGRDWRLDAPQVEMFGGTVAGEATGQLAAGLPYEVEASFRRWDPRTFITLFGTDVDLRGRWDGQATLKGLLAGDDLKGKGRFTLTEAGEELHGEAAFELTVDSGEVHGALEDRSRNQLVCVYRVGPAEEISGQVVLDAAALERLGPFLGVRLAGTGSVRGGFVGTVSAPRLAGEASLAAVEIEGARLGTVRGPFDISTNGLSTSDLALLDDRLHIQGLLGFTGPASHDLTAAAQSVPLETLALAVAPFSSFALPDLDGSVDGEIRVSAGSIAGQLRVAGLTVGGERLGDVEAEIHREDEAWRARGVLSGEEPLSGHFDWNVTKGGVLAGTVSVAGASLAFPQPLGTGWPPIGAEISGQAELSGTLQQPRGEARATLAKLEVGGRPLPDLILVARADGQTVRVEAHGGALSKSSVSIGLQSPFALRVEGQWSDFDVAPFLPPVPGLEAMVSGHGRIAGTLADPIREGEARIERFVIRRERLGLANRQPIEIRIVGGVVSVPAAEIFGDGQRVSLRGSIGGAVSEVALEASGDLALLEAIVPGVASARGDLRLQARAQKTPAGPWTLSGGGALRDGAMDLGLLVGLTDLRGDVELDDRRVVLREITGRVGGGDLLVDGVVALDDGFDVGWALRDANLGFPDWLDYRAGGNGRVAGAFARPRIEGEIEITQAVYDRKIEWAEFLPWFRREARRPAGETTLPVDLEVQLVADGGLFVDNNLAEAELQGSFRVRGNEETLTWSGRLDVLNGEFNFRRRRFTITAGSTQFLERRPLNPDLEFRGETTVSTPDGDYEISVHVGGTADRPRIEFTADDPALSENDVLALVTFGRTVAQLQAQGAGIELTEVLALTAGPNAERVEERIHNLLPVDQIEIQPTFSRTSGATEPRLSIGKDLTERFRALVSTGLGTERQQDVALEYEITPRISVQGIWESQTKSQAGAFGGDLKFRYVFRTFAQFSLLPPTEGFR